MPDEADRVRGDALPSLPQLRVLATPGAVAEAAATEIARLLAVAITERGVAHWSTTGGSAAPPIYRLLRVPPLRAAVAWERVQVWWGDDRFVPPDDPQSNVLPLEQILLEHGAPGADTGDVAGIRIRPTPGMSRASGSHPASGSRRRTSTRCP